MNAIRFKRTFPRISGSPLVGVLLLSTLSGKGGGEGLCLCLLRTLAGNGRGVGIDKLLHSILAGKGGGVGIGTFAFYTCGEGRRGRQYVYFCLVHLRGREEGRE